ncbi:MAG: phytoene desaturase family protein [Chloroflexota bacterium]
MQQIIIIGSGMGGLAAALRLRYLGFEVLVLEKQARPGGRSNLIRESGFRVDTGPTILVMKDTFEELYHSIGQNFQARLQLVQLDPNYRIYYHDGTYLELHSNMARLAQEVEKVEPGAAERLFRFIGEGARKYELGMGFVDRNFDRLTDLANPVAGWRLLRTNAQQNLYQQVAKFFNGNDKLTKAFSFHSMFLGLSPMDALAMYSLITYADLALGMWFPMGGIYSIVEDMLSLAQEMGVIVRTSAAVAQICVENGRATGVVLASGEQISADLVISNADLPYTYRELIEPRFRRIYPDQRLERMQYACSGYLVYLGIDRKYSHLRHQSLYFSQDYRANLDAIFKTRTLPEEPSFHMSVPTVTDPSLAPPGHSLIYLLAPMPNLKANLDWERAAPVVRERLLERLERLVDPEIRQHIVWERQYRPADFQVELNSTLGTAFGSLAHGFFQSSYFRPNNKARDIHGLYFVGQGTYPGIGMPMVMISSRLVAERIAAEWM